MAKIVKSDVVQVEFSQKELEALMLFIGKTSHRQRVDILVQEVPYVVAEFTSRVVSDIYQTLDRSINDTSL